MNLELSTWDDGAIRLTYWDLIGGKDRIFILGDDGQAYEEDVVEARHPVDLVAALRKMVQEGSDDN